MANLPPIDNATTLPNALARSPRSKALSSAEQIRHTEPVPGSTDNDADSWRKHQETRLDSVDATVDALSAGLSDLPALRVGAFADANADARAAGVAFGYWAQGATPATYAGVTWRNTPFTFTDAVNRLMAVRVPSGYPSKLVRLTWSRGGQTNHLPSALNTRWNRWAITDVPDHYDVYHLATSDLNFAALPTEANDRLAVQVAAASYDSTLADRAAMVPDAVDDIRSLSRGVADIHALVGTIASEAGTPGSFVSQTRQGFGTDVGWAEINNDVGGTGGRDNDGTFQFFGSANRTPVIWIPLGDEPARYRIQHIRSGAVHATYPAAGQTWRAYSYPSTHVDAVAASVHDIYFLASETSDAPIAIGVQNGDVFQLQIGTATEIIDIPESALDVDVRSKLNRSPSADPHTVERLADLESKTAEIDFDDSPDWSANVNLAVDDKHPYGGWQWISRGGNANSYAGQDYEDFDHASGNGFAGAGSGLIWVLPNNINWSRVRLVVRRADGSIRTVVTGQSLRNVPSTLMVANTPASPPDITVRWSASSDTHPYAVSNIEATDTITLETLAATHVPVWDGELGRETAHTLVEGFSALPDVAGYDAGKYVLIGARSYELTESAGEQELVIGQSGRESSDSLLRLGVSDGFAQETIPSVGSFTHNPQADSGNPSFGALVFERTGTAVVFKVLVDTDLYEEAKGSAVATGDTLTIYVTNTISADDAQLEMTYEGEVQGRHEGSYLEFTLSAMWNANDQRVEPLGQRDKMYRLLNNTLENALPLRISAWQGARSAENPIAHMRAKGWTERHDPETIDNITQLVSLQTQINSIRQLPANPTGDREGLVPKWDSGSLGWHPPIVTREELAQRSLITGGWQLATGSRLGGTGNLANNGTTLRMKASAALKSNTYGIIIIVGRNNAENSEVFIPWSHFRTGSGTYVTGGGHGTQGVPAGIWTDNPNSVMIATCDWDIDNDWFELTIQGSNTDANSTVFVYTAK